MPAVNNDTPTTTPGEDEPVRLLLIGDIHYYRLMTWPWRLLGKRLLGQLNLWLRRRRRFDRRLLPETVRRAIELAPHRVLMSGDLTTTALPGEFAAVAAAIKPLIERHPTLILPGNHDRYTFSAMLGRGLERHCSALVPDSFPLRLHLNGGWDLLAIDSAVPRMLSSRGRVGKRQLNDLAKALDQTPAERGVLMLCHYPVLMPAQRQQKWDHRLADSAPLLELLLNCRSRTIFCHGHVHEPWLLPAVETTPAAPPTPGAGLKARLAEANHLTVLNAGAPCMVSQRYPRGQGFWEIALPPGPHEAVAYRHHAPGDRPGEPWQAHLHADPSQAGRIEADSSPL